MNSSEMLARRTRVKSLQLWMFVGLARLPATVGSVTLTVDSQPRGREDLSLSTSADEIA